LREEVELRWPRAVPFRAFKTMSSGLGLSQLKVDALERGGVGGIVCFFFRLAPDVVVNPSLPVPLPLPVL